MKSKIKKLFSESRTTMKLEDGWTNISINLTVVLLNGYLNIIFSLNKNFFLVCSFDVLMLLILFVSLLILIELLLPLLLLLLSLLFSLLFKKSLFKQQTMPFSKRTNSFSKKHVYLIFTKFISIWKHSIGFMGVSFLDKFIKNMFKNCTFSLFVISSLSTDNLIISLFVGFSHTNDIIRLFSLKFENLKKNFLS